MKLCHLLATTEYELICGNVEREVTALEYHSEKVINDSVFFAIKGHDYDGKEYIEEAISSGAKVIVTEDANLIDYERYDDITILRVKDVRKALANMSCAFYNNPSEKMQVIGITGTKGKTSVSFMIRHILELAGIKTGIIGTVCRGYDNYYLKSDTTTPQSKDLQELMAHMVSNGCKAVVMEVSSQGLMQSRVEAIDFNIGVFTTISKDHIGDGEHKDFDEYLKCKSHLFDLCKRGIVNQSDSHWESILADKNLKQVIGYGENPECDFCLKRVELLSKDGILGSRFQIEVRYPIATYSEKEITLNIPGNFNVYNAMAAIAVTRALGIPWEIIQEGLATIKIPGRVETIECESDFAVMVDYAHNGIALKNLLESLKKYNPNRLVLVFGCGGNRDKNRRYEMGKVAFDLADYIIITSDNPRKEKPMDIINDITSVMKFCNKPILVIPDRREAIDKAMSEGKKGDIIIIAGKGHETYQIIGDEILDFDDKQVVSLYRKGQQ